MSVLHIVNKSPYDRNSLDTCLRLAKNESAILLIEDGIYAAQKDTGVSEKMIRAVSTHAVYALQPDLEARGISSEKLIDGVAVIDYDGFVKLTTEYSKLQSWL